MPSIILIVMIVCEFLFAHEVQSQELLRTWNRICAWINVWLRSQNFVWVLTFWAIHDNFDNSETNGDLFFPMLKSLWAFEPKQLQFFPCMFCFSRVIFPSELHLVLIYLCFAFAYTRDRDIFFFFSKLVPKNENQTRQITLIQNYLCNLPTKTKHAIYYITINDDMNMTYNTLLQKPNENKCQPRITNKTIIHEHIIMITMYLFMNPICYGMTKSSMGRRKKKRRGYCCVDRVTLNDNFGVVFLNRRRQCGFNVDPCHCTQQQGVLEKLNGGVWCLFCFSPHGKGLSLSAPSYYGYKNNCRRQPVTIIVGTENVTPFTFFYGTYLFIHIFFFDVSIYDC